MNNIINQSPYLKTSRLFPEEAHQLSVELNKAYLDIANAVNDRTISLFPSGSSALGGESWFITKNQRQQNFRQVYLFTATGSIPHNIRFINVSQFTKCTGAFTDGTNWYGAIFASSVAIAGQVSFYITPTNIVILAGAGAPAIVNGNIVLEWITNV